MRARTSPSNPGGQGGDYQRLPSLAAELVEQRPNLLAAFGTPAVRIAKSASVKLSPPVPVVFAMGADPVLEGVVESLNRPGGNMTGVTSIAGALAPKRLELVRGFLRENSSVAILINPGNPLSEAERRDTEVAVQAVGQRLEVLTASNQAEIDKAFAALSQRKVGFLIIAVDTFYYTQMQRMATLAAQAAVPAIGPLREFAAEGGLLSYGTSISDVNRQAGVMAGKVLSGALPQQLPVQQPTKFELVVNLKDREGARPRSPGNAARPRRRGDRMMTARVHHAARRCGGGVAAGGAGATAGDAGDRVAREWITSDDRRLFGRVSSGPR